MDLLDKLRTIERRRAMFAPGASVPGATVIERVLGPCEVVVNGRPTLMFGSNNYLGLTLHPEVVEAAQEALAQYGTGTTGSRAANGTLTIHEELERDFTQWFGKRHAMIFSTGYQANLAVIGGLCGPSDVILIDGDSHASIYDATRQTASQVIAFRHNSPESLRKKLERLPRGQRNRLVVVEGLYSIRGDVAPLQELVEVCRAHGAYLVVDEAHSLGTFGPGGLGCAEAQGVLAQVDFVVGTFSKSLAGIGGVCVSDHAELRALHFLARAYVFTASGSPSNIAGVRAAVRVIRRHPELRQQLWTNIRCLRNGLQQLGYAIGSTESPIVPILIGDEDRTIALWQQLLTAGLYLNLIVPPGCPKDE
jgi:8-amino-7-oxononanoate synthase